MVGQRSPKPLIGVRVFGDVPYDTTTAILNIDGVNFYMDAVKCCLMSAGFLEAAESDNR